MQKETKRSVKCKSGDKMNEEEDADEQQRMFAEARARMNGGAPVPQPQHPETDHPETDQRSLQS